jgi:hypothetical protein
MSDKENDKLDRILNKLDDHDIKLADIQRGIYGDPKNDVPGLMKENKDQEKRIKELEDLKKKGTYMVAGVTLAWPIIWHHIKGFFGL